jgi:hypothetical protein
VEGRKLYNKINELANKLAEGKTLDPGELDKVLRVYGDMRSGKTLTEDQGKKETAAANNDILKETAFNTGKEVFTGANADGEVSYKSKAIRGLAALLTGGASEVGYAVGNAGLEMKDYVEKGGNSALEAAFQSIGNVLKGEATGRLSQATGGLSDNVLTAHDSLTKIQDRMANGETFGQALKNVSMEVAQEKAFDYAMGKLTTKLEGAIEQRRKGGQTSSELPVTGSKASDKDGAQGGAIGQKAGSKASDKDEDFKPSPKAKVDKEIRRTAEEAATAYKNAPKGDDGQIKTPYGDGLRTEATSGASAKKPIAVTEAVNDTGQKLYTAAEKKPNLSGMRNDALAHAQTVAENNDVTLVIRSTTKNPAQLVESGKAMPKPEFLKNKTVNVEDTYLGISKTREGMVAHFDPGNPPSKELLAAKSGLKGQALDNLDNAVKVRFQERKDEFNQYQTKIQELKAKGVITVNNGIVKDAKTGKVFTGDYDIFDIRGPKGETLPLDVKERVIKQLENGPYAAQHEAHLDWDLSKADTYTKGIDTKILSAVSPQGGQPLAVISPNGQPISSVHYTGGLR